MSQNRLVTVIVPTRDEAADIEGCLAAIAAQDHPVNRLEVIVVDGCSSDGTADVARRVLGRWGFGSTAVLTNEAGTTSSNLNVGLAKASGEIICRVDARTRIEPHYVRTCVEVLTTQPEVAVVGGAQIAIARDPTAKAIGIARALNNRWSMGGSPYRRSLVSGPSDTVYLGAFRRAQLVHVRGWDEQLVSNQDFDLNQRMQEHGAVWFEASLRSGYVPRRTFALLWHQYTRFGRAKVRYWRTKRAHPEPRQQLLVAGPPLAAAVGLSIAAVAPSPVRTLVGGAGAGLVCMAAVERWGAQEPRGGVMAHLHGVGAMAVVGAGWWTGVASAALAPRERAAEVADGRTGRSATGAPPGA